MSEIAKLISQHPFTREMRPEHLAVLEKCAKKVSLKPGELLLKEREPAYQFYMILKGKVSLESRSGDKQKQFQTIGPGEVLGWSWLLSPFVSHASARAIEPTEAIFLDGAHLMVACENDHDFGYELMKRVSHMLMQRLEATRKLWLEKS